MRWRNWKLVACLILLGVILCALAYAAEGDEAEREVTEAEVPAAALAALKKLARGAEITEFAEEVEHGHTFYEGSWRTPAGANMDVLVTPTGDLVEIEEQVGADAVPAAVLEAARKAAGKDAKLAFEKKTMILYEVKFQKGDRRYELLLTPDARRVEEEIEKGRSEDDDEGDEDDGGEDEEQISIDAVPKAVKAAILKHAKGAEIKEIERDSEDGKVVYEVEIILDGKEIDLKIAPDGRLLSKEVADEDEDEADDEDAEEDDDEDDEDEDD